MKCFFWTACRLGFVVLVTLLCRANTAYSLISYEELCRGIKLDSHNGNVRQFSNDGGTIMNITTGQSVGVHDGGISVVSTGNGNFTITSNDMVEDFLFRYASVGDAENERYFISQDGGATYLDFTGKFTVNDAHVYGNPSTHLVPQGDSSANYRLHNGGSGGGAQQAGGVFTITTAVNYLHVDGLVGSPYGRNHYFCEFDLADGLGTYGAARHLYKWGTASAGLSLGSLLGPDIDGNYSAAASGDNDDGIVLPVLERGQAQTISVSVTGSGYLQVFFDWNGDGDFGDTVNGISETVGVDIVTPAGSGMHTINVPIIVPGGATQNQTLSRFRFSTETGIGASGDAIDGEVEDYAVTFTTPTPLITATKSVRPFDSNDIYGTPNPDLLYLPNSDVVYSVTLQNQSDMNIDASSLFLVHEIPETMEFYHADMDGAGIGTASGAVAFLDNNSGLSFDPAQNAGYSSNPTIPANDGECSYAPNVGYDPMVKFVCISPTGAFGFGNPDPSATFEYRARVK